MTAQKCSLAVVVFFIIHTVYVTHKEYLISCFVCSTSVHLLCINVKNLNWTRFLLLHLSVHRPSQFCCVLLSQLLSLTLKLACGYRFFDPLLRPSAELKAAFCFSVSFITCDVTNMPETGFASSGAGTGSTRRQHVFRNKKCQQPCWFWTAKGTTGQLSETADRQCLLKGSLVHTQRAPKIRMS